MPRLITIASLMLLFASACSKTLAVDGRGRETKAEIRVTRFVLKEAGKEQEVLPAGAVIEAEVRKDKMFFTGPLTPLADRLLPRFFDLDGGKSGPSDADIFGSSKRQPVGGVWTINQKLAAQKLDEMAPGIQPEQIKGSGRLVRVFTEGGKEYLEVEMTMSLETDKVRNPPPGYQVEPANLKATVKLHCPADHSTGPTFARFDMDMKGKFSKKGEAIVFSSSDTREGKMRYLP